MKKTKEHLITDSTHMGRLARYPYFAMMVEGERRMKALGLDELNPSYSIVFQFIGDGNRVTDMAISANTTKQNMKYLVDVLEKKGYVKRESDLTDGRAWIYKLSMKGKNYRKKGLAIIGEIEREWEAELGVRNYKLMKKLLQQLCSVIEENYQYRFSSK